jgi:hypothetical protein
VNDNGKHYGLLLYATITSVKGFIVEAPAAFSKLNLGSKQLQAQIQSTGKSIIKGK